MDDVVIRPLSSDLVDDYLEFFDRRAFSDNEDWSGCYCFFPYHDPQESDWKDRSAAENREAIADAIKQGSASGFLAYSDVALARLCEMNVHHQLRSLCHTRILHAAWNAGQDLTVHGWIYSIEDGHVVECPPGVVLRDEPKSKKRVDNL